MRIEQYSIPFVSSQGLRRYFHRNASALLRAAMPAVGGGSILSGCAELEHRLVFADTNVNLHGFCMS